MKKSLLISSILLVMSLVLAAPVFAEGQAGTTLTAFVTTSAAWTRTFGWTIDKSASPATWDVFQGDSAVSHYTISVVKDTGTDATFMQGIVSVTNGGAVATDSLQIVVKLYLNAGKDPPVLNSVVVDVSANPVLDPLETGTYTYRIIVPSAVPGATYKVTSEISILNHSGSLGTPKGPAPSATADFVTAPTLINDSINVDDSNGSTWSFNTGGSVSYARTFGPADAGTFNNTATIRQTGQADSASVVINRFGLNVSNTAATSFTRTYNWSVAKTANQTALTLTTGQVFPVNYTVTVNAGFADSAWKTRGTVTVSNPAPIAAVINAVSDVVSPGIAAGITGPAFPYTLPAGGSLALDYEASLPDASSRTSAAAAVLQNFTRTADATAPSGTTAFSSSAAVSFAGAAISEVNKSVTVNDNFNGASTTLGSLTYGSTLPRVYTYSKDIGPYAVSGAYAVPNTASVVGTSTVTANWTVKVSVPSTGGTLTQGYWKNHSHSGSANKKYDDAWDLIRPNGEYTPFFTSGKSWYSVMTVPPAGDAYYTLARQYVAAKLNILNGTSTVPAVDAAMTGATNFFNTNKPGAKLSNTVKNQLTTWANTLDQYNTGLIGPGHASE